MPLYTWFFFMWLFTRLQWVLVQRVLVCFTSVGLSLSAGLRCFLLGDLGSALAVAAIVVSSKEVS